MNSTPNNTFAPEEVVMNLPDRDTLKKRIASASRDGVHVNIARQLDWLGVHDGDHVEIQSLPPKVWDPLHEDERPRARYAQVASLQRVIELARSAEASQQYQGLYVLPNIIGPQAMQRGPIGNWQRYSHVENDKDERVSNATRDTDITHRRLVVLDLDPVRPDSSQSATPLEAQRAIARAMRVYLALAELLKSEAAVAVVLSGNGAQVWIKIEPTPSAPELTATVREFLLHAAATWSDEHVDVDTSVYEPRRIFPLAGTMKRKGLNDSDTGRVHRRGGFSRAISPSHAGARPPRPSHPHLGGAAGRSPKGEHRPGVGIKAKDLCRQISFAARVDHASGWARDRP